MCVHVDRCKRVYFTVVFPGHGKVKAKQTVIDRISKCRQDERGGQNNRGKRHFLPGDERALELRIFQALKGGK